MRRLAVIFAALSMILASPGPAAADHPPPGGAAPLPGHPVPNQGEQGEWELLKTVLTGNPHTDLDFFTQGGVTYASVGTLAFGPNQAGQSIVKLSDAQGNVTPDTVQFVAGHPSATCISNPEAALGLQHDVEATPKGELVTPTNWTDGRSTQAGDAQLLLDATDAPGRCHDQGSAGLSEAPQGGLEIIDITDVANPVEIGLISHIGEAHTVNVDPRRPHIAYAVSSDSISVDENGNRANEDPNGQPLRLDGFEVVDLRTCMTAPFGTMPDGLDVDEKRDHCRPDVYRYRYPTAEMALGHTNQGAIYGCHELEIFPDDVLACGGGAAMILLDMSDAFTADGTPRGDPLPCDVRESSTDDPGGTGLKTGAMVTDCVVGAGGADLTIPGWLALPGTPSLEGVKHIGSAHHMGRESATGAVDPAFPSTQDIDFDHEAELTHSGKFVLATDERGGGVLPPGASCAPNLDNPTGNGGIHAYRVDQLHTQMPSSPEQAHKAYALTPEGDKAVFRAPINTQPKGTICTAHVFQQIPGQNRIFMGWYSQGTQVVDYRENRDGTFEFAHVTHFIPTNANQWVSHVFKTEDNGDGTFTYYGVAGDFNLGEGGRNAIDVWRATLPAVGSTFADADDDDSGGDGGPAIEGGEGDGGDSGGPPILPATGGTAGLIPAGIALLGMSAVIGRSRRKRRD